MELLYLNGSIIPVGQAHISPFDRGFLYGDGLFETIRIYDGKGYLLGRHLRRLASGLDYLGIGHPSERELEEAVQLTVAANGVGDAVLRLTVTRGTGGSVGEPGESEAPTVLITLKPLLHKTDNNLPGGGEAIITLSALHVEPALGRRLKMLNYLTAIYSARELREAGVREGVLLTRDGIIAEGTVSTIFCIARGALFTPPLELGILPGITRERLLELAREAGVQVREERFGRAFLLDADECFYTNSVRELVPVVRVDDQVIGAGEPGELTRRLAELYRADIRRTVARRQTGTL